MNIYIGIDPGKNGSICAIFPEKIEAYKCPQTPIGMSTLFNDIYKHKYESNYVIGIEKVWAQPTNGTRHAFAFGTNYGMWLGLLGAYGVDPILILPNRWQVPYKEKYDIPKEYIEKKRKLKEIAQGYVDFNVTLATADSILIARYVKENYDGKKGIQNDIEC